MRKLPVVPPPETLSIAHWPTQQTIERAKFCLDGLVAHREAMSNSARSLKLAPSDRELKRVRTVLERYAISGSRKSIGDIKMLEPADWRNDDGVVRKSEVAKMIALLVGVLPAGNIPDIGIYVRFLIDDLVARQPGFLELECTCRTIRTKRKFMPSICEFVTELDQQLREWDERADALDEIEQQYVELVKLVASTEQELEAEAEANRRKAAKAATKVVGDRVRHLNFGVGTITDQIEVFRGCYHYRVVFDSNGESRSIAGMDYLEKLLEGDEGHAPSIRMLEHNSSLPMTVLHDQYRTVTDPTLDTDPTDSCPMAFDSD
jgi:hypothetical protein